MQEPTVVRAIDAAPTLSSIDPVQRVLLGYLSRYREPTRSNYLEDLRQFGGWCETIDVAMLAVGTLELQLYIDYLRRRGLADATVARRYGTVAGLLRYAYREGVIARNPADFVDKPKVNRDAQHRTRLSPLELADVIRQARAHRRPVVTGKRNLAIVLLMGTMGMRVGEVCSLDVDSVTYIEGQPALRFIGKGRKPAVMVMPFVVHKAVMDVIDDRAAGPIFLRCYGAHAGERITRKTVAEVIEALCKRAHIERHITPHAFRRSFAKTAHMQGRGLHEIQEALRHADAKTTGLYIGQDTTGSVTTQAVSAFLATLAS